jgi:hypothetical protein
MVSQSQGYEGFFDIVFSFLKRKTDFFTDFKKAESVIANAGKKHIESYARDAKDKQAKEQAELRRKEERDQRLKEEQAEKAKKESAASNQETIPKKSASEPVEESKDGKVAPNSGNGSKTDLYVWTQTLEEIQANVYIPSKTTKKDLEIRLELSHCYIALKDKSQIFVDTDWCDKIHPDDSYWAIEELENGGKAVQLTLSKYADKNWWDCLVKGEPVIDTQKVSPEPSKLSDLDGEMKSTVEKMMIDMRRKQAGLPSLEDEEKKNKMSEFMKAHPEMDFSKCKFN